MKSSNKIWICILIILIIAVNGLTVFYLLPDRNAAEEALSDGAGLFGTPTEILICKGDQEYTVLPKDESFGKILAMNEKRASFAESFFDEEAMPEEDALYLEYRYDQPLSLTLPFHLKTKSYTAERLRFDLEGSGGTSFWITANGKETAIGTLNIDADLIELAKKLLK